MKKAVVIISTFAASTMLLSSFDSGDSVKTTNSNEPSSNEVTIGAQVWMTKNLDVIRFRNGDPIREAKTSEEWEAARRNEQPAWCNYENDSANGIKYGKLYNWYAVNDVRGLAPEGYHVPSDAEWKTLRDYLGGASLAGDKMKSTSGWKDGGNGTNSSGFSGLPGGYRSWTGAFVLNGANGCWWSSTVSPAGSAWYLELYYSSGLAARNYEVNGMERGGFSVRCLRN